MESALAANCAWVHQTIDSGQLIKMLDKWPVRPSPQAVSSAISLEPLRRLMDERLSMMGDVARYKWNSNSAIADVPREQKIIDGLKAEAAALGVPEAWAERFFLAQIEAAKFIQCEHFAQWERTGAGRFADAPDLATVIRSRLDALTPQILRELAVAWPALADPAQRGRIAVTMLGMLTVATSAPAAALAAAPLTDGSASLGKLLSARAQRARYGLSSDVLA